MLLCYQLSSNVAYLETNSIRNSKRSRIFTELKVRKHVAALQSVLQQAAETSSGSAATVVIDYKDQTRDGSKPRGQLKHSTGF